MSDLKIITLTIQNNIHINIITDINIYAYIYIHVYSYNDNYRNTVLTENILINL